ncbi:hypothetical protein Moror_7124 [Moniliophthora roreri MCA 2997]|uniref:Protein kinase domain-containing protein n=1 Tax=Moniliophthora roreri (strain MCA 2997) TaxID=1381753 RepID=V2XAX1_MONRO|nr:hypothetical protein Moror_7124 [Moniliophthora roreri MCA 2997]
MKVFLSRLKIKDKGKDKDKDKDKDHSSLIQQRVETEKLPPLRPWTLPSIPEPNPLPDIIPDDRSPIELTGSTSSQIHRSSSGPTPTSPVLASKSPPKEDDRNILRNTLKDSRATSYQHQPDSTGHSRKTNDSATQSTEDATYVQKKVAFISPSLISDDQPPGSPNPSSSPAIVTPLKDTVSHSQVTRIDPRNSTSSAGASSSKTDIASTKNGVSASPHAQSLRSDTPYSQLTDSTSGSRILAATNWSEVTEEDLVSNLGPRERTRQGVLFEIIRSEDKYVQELTKMKETFIDPLLHPYSSGTASPVSPGPNFDYQAGFYHSESSSESTSQLPPIAARFLTPAASQTSKHNHPKSNYRLSDRRSTGNGTSSKPSTMAPFPPRSHHSLPPPPRSNQFSWSTKSLEGQPTVLGNTVAPRQLPEDLRICLEVLDNGVFDGHKRLLGALKRRYDEQYPLVRSLADIFVENSDIFQGYATYILHLERALEQVDAALSNVSTKKPKNQDVAEWQKVCNLLQKLEEIASEKGEAGLAIMLSTPFLRLLKYPLLFQNLLFHTDPSMFEYENTLQMVAEVEVIVRSIEDEKIMKEERDKTRDVFARIEGLDKVRTLAAPKPSRVLIEERQCSPTAGSLVKGESPQQGSRSKSSFKKLSDVLSTGKDLWLVVFNDVVLLCQKTGTTSLPIVATMNPRTKYTTAGRRNSHTKSRNLYKFIKIETWVIQDITRPGEGIVLKEDIARSRTREAQQIVPMPDDEDDESGFRSDGSDRMSNMSFSYWDADEVAVQKPPIKPRVAARRVGRPSYGKESSANATFGTQSMSDGNGTSPQTPSRRVVPNPTSPQLQPITVDDTKATVTRPGWNSNASATTPPRPTTASPIPKRSRNTPQTRAATRITRTAAKTSSPILPKDPGIGLHRVISNDQDRTNMPSTAPIGTRSTGRRHPPEHDIPSRAPNPIETSKTPSVSSDTNSSQSATPRNEAVVDTAQDLQALLVLPDPMKALLSLDVSRVPHVVKLLHLEAMSHGNLRYRKLCLRYLLVLVKKHHILPESLFLKHITREGTHALRGGGFSDIWKGAFEERSVCLKVMRIHLEANERKRDRIVAAFCREALVWTQLNHPNVLPLLGVNTELFQPALCLISPWMSNGDIVTYLEEHPDHDRLRSVHEIASGLAYLHSLEPMVIHGDIKSANILVDDLSSCRLADFGLAVIKESQRIASSTTSGGPKGTMRWMAPELFQLETGTEIDYSLKDVYAYACTVFEVMTGKPPFPDLPDAAVMLRVITGQRPPRPSDVWCPDMVWDLVERCWSHNPSERPRAVEIEQYLSLQRAVSGEVVSSRGTS